MAEIESKLAQIMSDIPEVEGMIAFDQSGKLISGQTIEKMDLNAIASTAHKLLEGLDKFGESIEKGKVSEITVSLADGFAVIVFGQQSSVVSFVGTDGKSQLALLARTIKNIV